MANLFRGELMVEGGGAVLETIAVLLAAVEIDGETSNRGCVLFCQCKRIVGAPMRGIDGVAENVAEQVSAWRTGLHGLVEQLWGFGEERGTLRAHGGKLLGVSESEAQGTISAHR